MKAAYLKRMGVAPGKSIPASKLGSIIQRRVGLGGGIGGIAYASGLGDGDLTGEIDDTQGDVGNGLSPTSSSTMFFPAAINRFATARTVKAVSP